MEIHLGEKVDSRNRLLNPHADAARASSDPSERCHASGREVRHLHRRKAKQRASKT
jgi:hypothetical protein